LYQKSTTFTTFVAKFLNRKKNALMEKGTIWCVGTY